MKKLIKCVPLRALFEYCCECDRLMPYDSDGHCYACGCDCPQGSADDDHPEAEWDLSPYQATIADIQPGEGTWFDRALVRK